MIGFKFIRQPGQAQREPGPWHKTRRERTDFADAAAKEDREATPGARPKGWGQIEPRQSAGRGWVYSEAMGLDREEIREKIRRYRKLLASNSDTAARKALEELIKEAEALLEDFDERS